MVFFLSLTATTLIIVSWSIPTFALNDWTVPCLHGQCAYDFAEGRPFLGSLQLIGTPDSIADLTEAAGWMIECQSNAMAQDIRLVCTDDGETPGCDHLLANGAEGKIVRLPEHCGRVPFARVVKSWISSDQSLPPSLIDRPRGYIKRPLVHALSLDTDLSRIDTENFGIGYRDISFSVQGKALSEGRNHARSPLVAEKRLFEDRSSAFRRTVASSIGPRFSDENSISFPIDVEQSLNLIDSSISCPAGAASLVVDVGAEAHMHVEISFDVTGSLSPFNITQFVLFADMNATINGSIHVQADVEGSFDTGRVPIFELPPMLEANITVPGILTIGTSFEVLGEFSADFASALDLDIGLAYTAQSVHMVFPPGHGASTGTFGPSDSSLSISASSALNANVDMTAHIIPRLEFDIVANVKNTSASILLDFDAFATLDLQGDVPQTTGTVGCDDAGASIMLPVQGCFDISTGLDVNVGADANFFGLFDAGTQLTLFNKTFDLFSGCFNASSSSSSRKRALDGSTLDRRDLACLAPYLLETTSLVKDVVIRASNQTARVALPPRPFAPFDARDQLTWCSNSSSSNSSSSSQTSGAATVAAGGMALGGARAGVLSEVSMAMVIASLMMI